MKCQCVHSGESNGNTAFCFCSGVRPARNLVAAVAIVAAAGSALNIEVEASSTHRPRDISSRGERIVLSFEDAQSIAHALAERSNKHVLLVECGRITGEGAFKPDTEICHTMA